MKKSCACREGCREVLSVLQLLWEQRLNAALSWQWFLLSPRLNTKQMEYKIFQLVADTSKFVKYLGEKTPVFSQ